MAKKINVYDESSIDVDLLDSAKIRKSPQVFTGGTDSSAILLCSKEPIQNCFDEAILDEVKNKTVIVSLDNESVWVCDAGRGIPVGIHKTSKASTLTTVLTTLSAGGKMRVGKDSGYSKATAGVHGMGVSITNALSKSLEVWTYRDKQWYTQTFAKGIATSKVIKCKAPKIPNVDANLQPKCGTTIKFIIDPTVFNKGAQLEVKSLKSFLDISAYLLAGVKIHLFTAKKHIEYYQPKGLAAFLEQKIEKLKATPYGKTFEFSNADFDLAMCFTDASDEHMSSFVNAVPTPEHGTHVNGLNRTIMEVLSAFKLKKQNFGSDDLRDGLISVLNVRVNQPQFTTQNKIKLSTPEATKMVMDALKSALTKFFNANKALAKQIIEVAHEVAQNKSELKLNKAAIRSVNINKKGKILLPPKALLSSTKDAMKRELYLVEGDSALGECRKARNPEYQEALPLKGKPLNVMQAKSEKIYANKEIMSVLQMVGFSESKKDYRIGKLILMADPDVDGFHIATLLCSMTYKMFRDLIEKGRLYTVDTPLFSAQIGKEHHYADTKDELRAKSPNKKIVITRFKGLGEMNATNLAEVAFDPATRRLRQITMSDKKGIAKFLKLVGKEADFRKSMLGVG